MLFRDIITVTNLKYREFTPEGGQGISVNLCI